MVAQDVGALFLSVVSLGELEAGLTTMQDMERRMRLEASLASYLSLLCQGSVLPVTRSIATRWGKFDGIRQMGGRPLGAPDGLIAATAFEHDLILVTRNVKDFDRLGLTILNPWEVA